MTTRSIKNGIGSTILAILELEITNRTKIHKTVYYALQREYELLIRSIDKTKQNISSFERKYNLLSQKFLNDHSKMSDNPDFVDWYGEIRILNALNTEVAQITEMLEQCIIDDYSEGVT